MLSEPTCTSTTKASTTSSRSTSLSTKLRSRRPSRNASKLCAICSRRTRRVLEHRYLYAMYFYDATGIKSLRFPLGHYTPAQQYKKPLLLLLLLMRMLLLMRHIVLTLELSSASHLCLFVFLCRGALARHNAAEPLLESDCLCLSILSLFSSFILLG